MPNLRDNLKTLCTSQGQIHFHNYHKSPISGYFGFPGGLVFPIWIPVFMGFKTW
ncbi:hypothetical protein MBAV_001376 [Candidatus Magnetobacterium bavaricum]|uniref:Uncharacterized protein n=1 Tax=Candidatus Magnetobacterium bavaricum TaxID=29290 RepID=A0A0F3GX24_9BACT|nr:hypothetical protein MBAV_001374 [Candidatus Magnetobacterium bavaricum]KJU86432.1 hypothetical protein MBAV_001376 [Candidatus Magnetobacterium bavaricum]